jgi:hypothetical protein
MLLTYGPVVFAFVGICEGACFRQDETFTFTPFSSASCPRYVPHGQQAMAARVGTPFGLTPSCSYP